MRESKREMEIGSWAPLNERVREISRVQLCIDLRRLSHTKTCLEVTN